MPVQPAPNPDIAAGATAAAIAETVRQHGVQQKAYYARMRLVQATLRKSSDEIYWQRTCARTSSSTADAQLTNYS
jgi:adenine/guanine phosphoribosyltransferase-like PRPP-binding protein